MDCDSIDSLARETTGIRQTIFDKELSEEELMADIEITTKDSQPLVINSTDGYYPDSAEALYAKRGITVNGSPEYARIEDPEVLRILLSKFNAQSDKMPLSLCRSITDLGSIFNNSSIVSFNGLKYFNLYNLGSKRNTAANGDNTFRGCANLKELTLPESVRYIPYSDYSNPGAFYGCPNIEKVHIPSIEWFLTLRNDSNGNGGMPTTASPYLKYYVDGEPLTEINAPDNITSIPGRLLDSYKALTKVSGENIDKIGYYAFVNCSSLVELNTKPLTSLNYGNTSQGSAFQGCTSLVRVQLASSLTTIPNNTFNGCTKLVLDNLPASLTTIAAGAFSGCTSLGRLDISKVTSIGGSAFYGCTNLELIGFDSHRITRLEDEVFRGCSNLEITSLEGVTYLGRYSLYGCGKVHIPSLPDSLVTMSPYAPLNGVTIDYTEVNAQNMALRVIAGAIINYLVLDGITLSTTYCTGGEGTIIKKTCTLPSGVTYSWRDVIGNEHKFVIIEEGVIPGKPANNSYQEIHLNISGTICVDLPSSYREGVSSVSANEVRVKYYIIRGGGALAAPSGFAGTYLFLDQNATNTLTTGAHSTKEKYIGGAEWIEAMKDLYEMYKDRSFNRCSNPTSSGYTSTYDNQFHPWSDEWADYDIFGVDRPS